MSGLNKEENSSICTWWSSIQCSQIVHFNQRVQHLQITGSKNLLSTDDSHW